MLHLSTSIASRYLWATGQSLARPAFVLAALIAYMRSATPELPGLQTLRPVVADLAIDADPSNSMLRLRCLSCWESRLVPFPNACLAEDACGRACAFARSPSRHTSSPENSSTHSMIRKAYFAAPVLPRARAGEISRPTFQCSG